MSAQNQFRHPVFLTAGDEPRHRVRCPIHGFIRFSENERGIIDHPLFRRLRWIKQLALTDLIYPGATHTRFEHSLGVTDIASTAFDRLAASRGDLMEEVFGTVAELRDAPLAKARQLLRLAALLHDVGHSCFSHAAEKVIHKESGHEALTVKVVREGGLLGGEITRRFFPGCADLTARIIQGGRDLPPQLQVIRDLVSGQMDADRSDYLLRDSHHCGVDYGVFDLRRMIECLALRREEFTGALEVALHRDGIHTFEALILARYQMNTQVYYHRLRRVYDRYLQEYFRAKGDEAPRTPEQILQHNDVSTMAAIMADAVKEGEPAQRWASRIISREHHRVVFETGEDADAMELLYARKIFERIKDAYSDREFLLDIVDDATIHKLLVPGDKVDNGLVQLQVIDRDGTANLLGQKSHILGKVPRWFQIARIFCDLTREQKLLQAEIARKCKLIHQEVRG